MVLTSNLGHMSGVTYPTQYLHFMKKNNSQGFVEVGGIFCKIGNLLFTIREFSVFCFH